MPGVASALSRARRLPIAARAVLAINASTSIAATLPRSTHARVPITGRCAAGPAASRISVRIIMTGPKEAESTAAVGFIVASSRTIVACVGYGAHGRECRSFCCRSRLTGRTGPLAVYFFGSRRGRPVSTWVAKLQGRTEVHESSLNSFANYSCQRRQLRSGRLTRPNLRPAGACATDPGDAFTGSLCIVLRGAALRDTVAGLASSLLLG